MTAPFYDDGTIVIYHGDCRDITEWVTAGDVMVSDPPYGLNAPLNSGGSRGRTTAPEDRVVPDWDVDLEARDDALRLWGVPDRPAAVFASVTHPPPPGSGTRRPLVWDKGEAVGMGEIAFPWRPNYELIWVLGPGWRGPRTSSVLRSPIVPGNRVHPTQKPTDLMRELIRKAPSGVVVDPFMGSGSTLRAAKDLGRRAIGVELDERYCEIAARRLGQEVLDFA